LITASMAGYRGVYSAPLYCATKHAIIGFVRSMAEADRLEGVKVVTIAPGNVRTPLWTAQQKEQFHFTEENSILPEDVANSMISLIQDGKYGGGASLEISPGLTRTLGTWNISESKVAGHSEMDHAPIKELMRKERNTGVGLSA